MTITKIEFRFNHKRDGRIKAFADIYIKEGFMVHDVKIVQEPYRTLCLDFPLSASGKPTFEPWKLDARGMIERIVIRAYWEAYHTQHNAIEFTPKPCYNTDTE